MTFTEPEYLALEAVAEIKHEFFDGQMLAMAGEELVHNQVASNVLVELGLARRDDRVLGSDQRVPVQATRTYFYPDVIVICADPVLVDPKLRSLTNPAIVVEVLSPTTELKDRSAKWIAYRTIPTLTDYLMIASERREVEHYHRDADGTWRSVILREGRCDLSNGVALELAQVYRLTELA